MTEGEVLTSDQGPAVQRARRALPWLVFAGLITAALLATDPVADTGAASAAGPDAGAVGAGPGGVGTAGAGQVAGSQTGSDPAGTAGGATPGSAPTGGVAGPLGVSVFGVDCATGRRQLPTSQYGAACMAASDATNAGATALGVTADTITVTLRLAESGQSAALVATAGSATDSLGGDQDGVAADMGVLVEYFNRVFDLYGRRVVLRVFDGQGDFLAEFQNQNIQGAQADAARARDLGAFADVSIVTQTQPYSESLVSQGIAAFSPVYLTSSWYADHAPYAYGVLWPASDHLGSFIGSVVCRRMGGDPAIFAGQADLVTQPRRYGIIHPENPEFAKAADAIDRAIRGCGHTPARRIAYALNIATMQQEQTNAVAQMKDAGVTTILCVCDEFSPIFLTRAADQQQYGPEWIQVWWPDPWSRLASANQWSHSIHTGGASPDYLSGEVGATWQAAAGGREPRAAVALPLVHQQLLVLFSALQAAGPNLTPQTLQRGFASLPSTAAGVFGPWSFGGAPTPRNAFALGWYDPAAQSRFDGQPGAILDCEGGRYFPFADPGALGSGPLACFR